MKQYMIPTIDLQAIDAEDIVCTSSQDPERPIGVTLSNDSNGIQNWHLGGGNE